MLRLLRVLRAGFSPPRPSVRWTATAAPPSCNCAPPTPAVSAVLAGVQHAVELLPHQGILENFVHHNPLGHLESLGFKEALEYAHKLESYSSPGDRLYSLVHVDPRKRVNEAIADLSSVFLDRGAAKWAPKFRDRGFLYFFASLEGLGYAPWRASARRTARRVVATFEAAPEHFDDLAERILQENLQFFGVPPEEWADSIRAMLLEVRGWAGMFHRMETHPAEAPTNAKVRLLDFCAVKSILVRSSVEKLARSAGWDPSTPMALFLNRAPKHHKVSHHESHTSAIAHVDQSAERRETMESEFERALLSTIGTTRVLPAMSQRPSLQLYTCIDDRECSFRRHVEETSPSEIETFGVAGFFGIPIRYEPADGRPQMVLAPEGQEPTAVLREAQSNTDPNVLQFKRWRRVFGRLALAWENASFSPVFSLVLSCVWPLSVARLLLIGFAPDFKRRIEDRATRYWLPKPPTDFQPPFPPEQAAALLARTFKDIGTHERFAPIVIVLGHGAISVNNPFFAAYNCGACGGREGGPNARLLARFANDKAVRASLRHDHGVAVPDDTVFIGGMHNTTTDTADLFDLDLLPESHRERAARAQKVINDALGKNALERCHRFMLAEDVRTPDEALTHVRVRATDLAEVRPELNHATNAGVVVGRRELTKNRFLDRRVFLPSYDPHSDDARGTNLEHVLGPALVVCSGINLEYLFSTISVDHHGAGTKAPLNVVGTIGVVQGTSGDLRPGLPSQMTEMHTPVRGLYVIDAPVERVEAVLARRPELCRLVRNEWVRLFVRDPETGRFYRQSAGQYEPVEAAEAAVYVPFTHHRNHGLNIARQEAVVFWTATAGMVASCAVPVYLFGATAMNPYGTIIALCGTMLSLPVLAFSRRYLHGEFMFGRFATLCVGLSLGFNLVALAPTLLHAIAGWGLFGFASTFLIGAYNDRASVRNNATFAFAAYRVSDFALLAAAAFSTAEFTGGATSHPLAAAGLLVAAMLKSSQFPLTALFVRSMEGPTPASALGYAGLSAHVGVVLLTSTMPLWFGYDWARVLLASVGAITTLNNTLISKIRADRKGAIARATSATLGVIFIVLAMGHPHIALWMSLGHAAFRMIQILRAPNVIADTLALRSALGGRPRPKLVPDWLYRLSWRLRRIDTDFQLLYALHWATRRLSWPETRKSQQWLVTGVCAVLAGIPFTPVSDYLEHLLLALLPTHPGVAIAIMAAHFCVSVVLVRFLLLSVLRPSRFLKRHVGSSGATGSTHSAGGQGSTVSSASSGGVASAGSSGSTGSTGATGSAGGVLSKGASGATGSMHSAGGQGSTVSSASSGGVASAGSSGSSGPTDRPGAL